MTMFRAAAATSPLQRGLKMLVIINVLQELHVRVHELGLEDIHSIDHTIADVSEDATGGLQRLRYGEGGSTSRNGA